MNHNSDDKDELFEALYNKNENECVRIIQSKRNLLNFNKRDELGNTYLLTACKKSLESVAILLVRTNKCNLLLIGMNNMNVLELANLNKLNYLAKLLINTDVNLLNNIGDKTLLSILQTNKSDLIGKITNERVANFATANGLDILVKNKQKIKQKILNDDIMLESIIENNANNQILELTKIKLANKNKECIICATTTDIKFIFNVCHHVFCLDTECCNKLDKCPICRTMSSRTRCYFVED